MAVSICKAVQFDIDALQIDLDTPHKERHIAQGCVGGNKATARSAVCRLLDTFDKDLREFCYSLAADYGRKTRQMRNRLAAIAIASGCVLSGAASYAQTPPFPTRPITVVVPFPAGGPTDALVRVLSDPMRTSLGQPLIVENVSGATGSIGVGRVAQARPDGYTVSIGNTSTHVVNGAIFPLKYDLLTDLEPVALLGSNPLLLASKNAVPAKDLRELIAWVKRPRARCRPAPPVPARSRRLSVCCSRTSRARACNSSAIEAARST